MTIESSCSHKYGPWSNMAHKTVILTNKFQGLFKDFKDKLQFSRTKDLFNKSTVFNLLLRTLLAKTVNGVTYDFYIFSHG